MAVIVGWADGARGAGGFIALEPMGFFDGNILLVVILFGITPLIVE